MAMDPAVLEQMIGTYRAAEADKSNIGLGKVVGSPTPSLGTDGNYNLYGDRALAKAIVDFLIAHMVVNVTIETGSGVPGTGLGTPV